MTGLQGVFNILATPFQEDGSLDEYSLQSLVDFQLQSGAAGLTILGIMGEVHKLSDAERQRIMEIVLKQVNGRIPVVVNVTYGGTRQAIEFARSAEAMGAAGVMAAPPVNLRNLEAVRDFYRAVAEAVSIPIVVQDEPSTSNTIMPPSFLAQLDLPYIKLEEPPVPHKISRILEKNPRLRIFGGLGGMYFLEELERGAVGTMTGFAYTEILVEIYNAFQKGELDRARETFFRYSPLFRYEGQLVVGLAVRKEILRRRGIIRHAGIRAPGIRMDSIAYQELDRVLKFVGL